MIEQKAWLVYIIRCADSSLYTGATNDLPQRLAAHEAGRGAKYLRGRGPLTVVYQEDGYGHGGALQREAEIKRLSRTQKLRLIETAQRNL